MYASNSLQDRAEIAQSGYLGGPQPRLCCTMGEDPLQTFVPGLSVVANGRMCPWLCAVLWMLEGM
jgi:hypothetical protein